MSDFTPHEQPELPYDFNALEPVYRRRDHVCALYSTPQWLCE